MTEPRPNTAAVPAISTASGRYEGTPPPPRFNMAAWCLAPAAHRPADKVALTVVHDAAAPANAAETWTYGALDAAVRRVGGALAGQGLAPGDRIMLRMGNTSAYALAYFGALAAGLVPLASSAQLTEEEAGFLMADSGAAALVAAADLDVTPPAGVLALRDADIAEMAARADPAPYADTAADDPAFLVYTSGTSGKPKGVLHAHRAAWGRRPMFEGWYGMGPDDRILHAGAFNWTYTLGVGLTDPWANGASTILYNGQKDPGVWLGIMARFRATLFAAVPTLYRQILKYDDPSAHDLSAFRHGLTAGEALPPALAEAWRARTGTPLYEALGMSECSTYVSSAPAVPPRPGSPGKPQPGRAVAILDPAGGETPISRGETGLLAVHRTDPGLMLGYWNRPDEEAEVFRGAWFVGGDLAAMDADGYIHFKGRNDDLMNAFGYRVSPMEVEAALADHPDLAEVAVTTTRPRPDVEVVTAFAVPREGTAPDEALRESVLEAARRRLAGYKVPRAVVFVDALPRTPNGKVLRRALRDGGNGA